MNKCFLTGRLCGDVELRTLPTGSITTTVTLAVDRRRREDGTDFLICEAWGKTAEIMNQFVHKGDKLTVVGRIKSDEYTGRDGQKKYSTHIVIEEVEFPPKAANDRSYSKPAPSANQPTQMQPADNDSDLPF